MAHGTTWNKAEKRQELVATKERAETTKLLPERWNVD